MFILLKDGSMFNLFWLQDCYVDSHNKKVVIFLMINGVQLTEEYDSEAGATSRVQTMEKCMELALTNNTPLIVEELPTENISENRTYYIKDSEDPEDTYQEWVYINGKWEMQGITKGYSYSKQDIDKIKEELTKQINNVQTNLDTVEQDIQEQLSDINAQLTWKEY